MPGCLQKEGENSLEFSPNCCALKEFKDSCLCCYWPEVAALAEAAGAVFGMLK